jgi:hypothetical protein
MAMKYLTRIGVLLLVVGVVACAWLQPLDGPAQQQVDDGLQRALVTYGSARVLHALVSVVQGTEISASPAGVGATFTPGQALAPAAEMLKQFSDLMLFVCVAFGVQKLLIIIGAFWLSSLALTVVLVTWLALYFRHAPVPALLKKFAVVLLLVRFAVPLSLMGSALVFAQILHEPYLESQAALGGLTASATTQAAAVAKPAPPESPGMVDSIKKWFGDKAAVATEKLDSLRQAVADAAEHLVRLMAVFLLQTIVLPLLLVVGLWAAVRAVFRGRPAV